MRILTLFSSAYNGTTERWFFNEASTRFRIYKSHTLLFCSSDDHHIITRRSS